MEVTDPQQIRGNENELDGGVDTRDEGTELSTSEICREDVAPSSARGSANRERSDNDDVKPGKLDWNSLSPSLKERSWKCVDCSNLSDINELMCWKCRALRVTKSSLSQNRIGKYASKEKCVLKETAPPRPASYDKAPRTSMVVNRQFKEDGLNWEISPHLDLKSNCVNFLGESSKTELSRSSLNSNTRKKIEGSIKTNSHLTAPLTSYQHNETIGVKKMQDGGTPPLFT